MAKNINDDIFNEATKLKLSIFGECFNEWFPVFCNHTYVKKVIVFDFFAGSGTDIENYPGSPLVLLDKAKGTNKVYCQPLKRRLYSYLMIRKKRKVKS